LLVKGSDTQWYQNVLKNPSIRIDAGGAQSEVEVVAASDATQVKSVVERFCAAILIFSSRNTVSSAIRIFLGASF